MRCSTSWRSSTSTTPGTAPPDIIPTCRCRWTSPPSVHHRAINDQTGELHRCRLCGHQAVRLHHPHQPACRRRHPTRLRTSRPLGAAAYVQEVAARNGGCRFLGCSRPVKFTEAHHIHWWERHGSTTTRTWHSCVRDITTSSTATTCNSNGSTVWTSRSPGPTTPQNQPTTRRTTHTESLRHAA